MARESIDTEIAGDPVGHPSFRDALRFWWKLGWISFGGPSGQIAIMHSELVERRRWISNERFLHALNFCMLLPGPEAQQLATYCGWLLHGNRGGIAAGVLFVLPAAFLLWVLSYVYMAYGEVKIVAAAFDGLKPAVLAIVLAALWKIGCKALKNRARWALAFSAFVGIYFLGVPFPLIVLGAACAGFAGGVWRPDWFVTEGVGAEGMDRGTPGGWGRTGRILILGGMLWSLPVLLLGGCLGFDHVLFREGVFFSKTAVVTFGGAYAVLPYVGQQAVEHHGWLQAGQMMDGLGLAETTPGPLVMVLQFVGFVGAWQHPGSFPPLLAGTLGALITSWVTFVPCFIWILAGAPFVERLRGNRRLSAAMNAVTAAVVGVILNLAVWFGLHALLPASGGVNWAGLCLVIVVLTGLIRWKWEVVPVVFGAAAFGVGRSFF
ncbi:MAG: chromate efflux transporter [Verrucomicrobiae bacterium]|jgi:chromate transporter|nr:chromate efflux transporter [Verrucomicrobiae bacterium]